MRSPEQKTERIGFTTIELLVVISIIALLVALLLPAVVRLLAKGPETTTTIEVSQWTPALAELMAKKNLDYFPSRIRLREDMAYGNGAYEQDSRSYLLKFFGAQLGRSTNIDWNGDGQLNGPHDLTGDQCLVFFLGGIPTGGQSRGGSDPGLLGFSSNPRNPSAPGGERLRFFEFNNGRLLEGPGGFYSYVDGFENGRPYAYFSNYGTVNGYNKYGSSDCPNLRVQPAQLLNANGGPTNPRRYFADGSFQIVSAGQNGQFGSGLQPEDDDITSYTSGRFSNR